MNPYDFVRLAGEPERMPAPGRLQFRGTRGRIDCTLTARTPLFTYQTSHTHRADLPAGGTHEEVQFPLREGRPVIMGASLKGMLRGVTEAASRSCVSIFEGRYERGPHLRDWSSLLPQAFRRCQRPESLCPACRLFGTAHQQSTFFNVAASETLPPAWTGTVSVSDALAIPGAYVLAEPFTLAPESPPKPHHEAFYLINGRLAGRKFYLHQPGGPQPYPERTPDNRTIQPAVSGSTFAFSVEYELLHDDDRRLLLYALVLESGLAHKLGLGKPLGLGSVQITLQRLVEQEAGARYRSTAGGDARDLQGEELETFLAEQLRPIRNSQTFFLTDLRRVLRLEHQEAVGYPGLAWFRTNGAVPLRQINMPGQRAGLPLPPSRRPESAPGPAVPAFPPGGRVLVRGGRQSTPAAVPRVPAGTPQGRAPVRPTPPAAITSDPQDAQEERNFTLGDLLARFGKQGGDDAPAGVGEQPDRGRRKLNRADRAREEQRRLLERLRSAPQDE